MRKKNREEGMVMIEAIYVVVIAIMMIFFLMNVGFVYYNRMVVTAVADEAAASIADNYGYTGREPFYSYVAPRDFKGTDPYRYFNNEKLINSGIEKGKWYASYLLSESEWSSVGRENFDDVKAAFGKNELGMNTITITIESSYPAFSLNPMSFFGLDPYYTVHAEGVAVCYDPIHQMNTTALLNEVENQFISGTPFVRELNTVIGIINKIIDILKK